MKLVAWVEAGNAAMQTPSEASDAIQKALGGVGKLIVGLSGGIFDTNGNLVGKWEVTE